MPRWPYVPLDEPPPPRDVIVRAYGDEPVRLLAVGEEPVNKRHTAVLVAKTPAGRAIGFPSDMVYPFDANWYARLRRAYESGDRRALLSTWTQVPFDRTT